MSLNNLLLGIITSFLSLMVAMLVILGLEGYNLATVNGVAYLHHGNETAIIYGHQSSSPCFTVIRDDRTNHVVRSGQNVTFTFNQQ